MQNLSSLCCGFDFVIVSIDFLFFHDELELETYPINVMPATMFMPKCLIQIAVYSCSQSEVTTTCIQVKMHIWCETVYLEVPYPNLSVSSFSSLGCGCCTLVTSSSNLLIFWLCPASLESKCFQYATYDETKSITKL